MLKLDIQIPQIYAMISYLTALITFLIPLYFYQTWRSRGLNRFQGPFLASLSDFWKILYARENSLKENNVYVDVHEKYGDVVRIGPNNLSFANPQAILDIYGTKGSDQKVCNFTGDFARAGWVAPMKPPLRFPRRVLR